MSDTPIIPNQSMTARGFMVYDEFEDMYGGTVRVQESSNIEGGVWVHYEYENNGKPDPHYPNGHICGSPHLSDDQAQRLINALAVHLFNQNEQESES